VVAISTDKAVEPINTMGLSKALQEKIFILGNTQQWKTTTKFALVRYGNVVASRGSVIPLFKKQIGKGGPVTITHKEMTRFILTLSQGIGLVYTALEKMQGGEIFIPHIRPLKVIDLASVMIETLHPLNNNIVEIGIRPGEKIHETLLSQMESHRVIKKEGYYIIYPELSLKEIGYNYKIKEYNSKKIFRYSSNIGPFLTKEEIKEILINDGVFS
jgi:UDP-glucose 4-epimerase